MPKKTHQTSIKGLIFSALFVFLFTLVDAQEEIVPLGFNRAIPAYLADHPILIKAQKKKTLLTLPFFDDFSTTRVFPDREKWIDRDVYINNGFAVNPPSHGVATFDGLDQYGFPYNVNGNNNPRSCDTITSQPIDLSAITISDSLYLSFYLQQKGMGERPESNDSFLVELKDSENNWIKLWGVNGEIDSLGRYPFEQIILLVPEAEVSFYHDSFQLRFRNFGNRTGSLDHWNLDYVYLDQNRTMLDTIEEEVSIYRQPKGLFSTYYSMPWRHCKQSFSDHVTKKIDFNVYNKAESKQSPDVTYTITDVTNNETVYSSAINQILDIGSFSQKTGEQSNGLPYTYFDTLSSHQVDIELKLNARSNNIVGNLEQLKDNDDFIMYQRFDDYFSYDDGTAEGGYGLKNTRQGGVALRYELEMADSLTHIAFHFTSGNEVLPEDRKFNIIIWEKLFPSAEVVHKMVGAKPIYTGSKNGFVLYELEEPLLLSGSFFIGWEQFSVFNLNVGIDLNYRYFNDGKPNPNLYFNALGKWENSQIVGTPMIRPVFGKNARVGVEKKSTQTSPTFSVFPNPSSTSITIQSASNHTNIRADILDLNGRILQTTTINEISQNISVQSLAKGLYIIRVVGKNGSAELKKFIRN